ncbi:MAG: sugar phosphate nucleotidyltransferase, partial [Pseudorhodobacter sp.]|nr:sugar phosphate nucleotidyltransferase [Pseudorhodobacter sp.]
MAESTITPVILCGGAGTRLWPVSRKSYPKQFSALMGQGSLFQQTVGRFQSDGFGRPVIVTGDQFRFIVVEQLAQEQVDPAAILVEPSARNTAPA